MQRKRQSIEASDIFVDGFRPIGLRSVLGLDSAFVPRECGGAAFLAAAFIHFVGPQGVPSAEPWAGTGSAGQASGVGRGNAMPRWVADFRARVFLTSPDRFPHSRSFSL